LSWAIGVSLSLSAGAALADAPKAASASQTPGLLSFPNVKVVNVPPANDQPVSAVKSEGVRAYTTDFGTLRAQTIEEAAAASAAPAADEAVEVTYRADGKISVKLNDSHSVYQVAHKQDGKIVVEEATGKAEADKLTAKGPSSGAKEVSNDR
jgi:hypothetical protein